MISRASSDGTSSPSPASAFLIGEAVVEIPAGWALRPGQAEAWEEGAAMGREAGRSLPQALASFPCGNLGLTGHRRAWALALGPSKCKGRGSKPQEGRASFLRERQGEGHI